MQPLPQYPKVSHEAGIFRSVTLDFNSEDEKGLKKIKGWVLSALGMEVVASHIEINKSCETGQFILDSSPRVGRVDRVEMGEASSGINFWQEGAKLEYAEVC